jgi:UDP-N-acetylmuramate dehydrogenase
MLDRIGGQYGGAKVMQAHPGVPLAPLTTLGIGGPATVIDVDNGVDFRDVVDLIGPSAVAPVCLGWGSNVLVADDGTDAPVLLMRTTGISTREQDDHVLVTVQAGHSLPDLVDYCLTENLIGMETLAGVPGTVGAMPIQNVGAYGQETADTLTEVTAWDWHHQRQVTLAASDCAFGHRSSLFKGSHRWTILRVSFALTRSRQSAPITYSELATALDVPLGSRLPTTDVVDTVIAVRRRKGMVLEPDGPDNRSVGSIFPGPIITAEQAETLRRRGGSPHTYPDGHSRIGSSWLLRDAGYKLGQVIAPGVRISTKHHTLVADTGATAAVFATASAALRAHVYQTSGIHLTFEPDFIGREAAYEGLMER